MQCPKCRVEARISRAYTAVEGDNSPDTETRIYTVQDFVCVNPQCGEFGRKIEEARHRETIGPEDATATEDTAKRVVGFAAQDDCKGGDTDG